MALHVWDPHCYEEGAVVYPREGSSVRLEAEPAAEASGGAGLRLAAALAPGGTACAAAPHVAGHRRPIVRIIDINIVVDALSNTADAVLTAAEDGSIMVRFFSDAPHLAASKLISSYTDARLQFERPPCHSTALQLWRISKSAAAAAGSFSSGSAPAFLEPIPEFRVDPLRSSGGGGAHDGAAHRGRSGADLTAFDVIVDDDGAFLFLGCADGRVELRSLDHRKALGSYGARAHSSSGRDDARGSAVVALIDLRDCGCDGFRDGCYAQVHADGM